MMLMWNVIRHEASIDDNFVILDVTVNGNGVKANGDHE